VRLVNALLSKAKGFEVDLNAGKSENLLADAAYFPA